MSTRAAPLHFGGLRQPGLHTDCAEMTLLRLVAAVLAAVGASCAAPPEPAPDYRCTDCNVVFISVDTLRADHVGAYGYTRPTTPNIDALAAKGVLFENA
ncbi:MAG TPA: sulfatase-like hydrolase/transferase, partial [Candidatus Binatia bacterium]|nr:sulfatase-like hydrolase/transferase [Candidatus Binatia bacterium]